MRHSMVISSYYPGLRLETLRKQSKLSVRLPGNPVKIRIRLEH